jgi:nitroreductase
METLKAIENRQSCRAYTGEQVTEGDLQTILKAANAAPVGMGKYEDVRLTVVQNKELLAKLDGVGAVFFGNPDMHPLYGAPTVIIVSNKIADPKQSAVAYSNAACVVENMALASTELGLGNVYLMGAVMALAMNADLCKEFNIAEGFVPTSAIAVGKAATPAKIRTLTTTKIATDYLR